MTRTKILAFLLGAYASGALADTPPARAVNSLTYDATSNAITSTVSGGKRGLDCNMSNALAAPGNTQIIVSGSAIDPRAIRALTTSDQVSCAQQGSWTIGLPSNAAQEGGGNLAGAATSLSAINGKMTSFDLDSGAGVQNVQGTVLRLSASGGSVEAGTGTDPLRIDPTGTTTQPVSAASLPLPAGAASATLQTAGNSSLSSIDGKITNTTGGAIKTDGSAFTQPISAAALPLPPDAATATDQATGNASLSSIDGKLAAGHGAAAGAIRTADADHGYADSAFLDYGSTNITTGAWVQLIASTAGSSNLASLFSACGQVLELGVGGSGSEARVMLVPPGGLDGQFKLSIASGSRVSIRAVSGICSAGYLALNVFN